MSNESNSAAHHTAEAAVSPRREDEAVVGPTSERVQFVNVIPDEVVGILLALDEAFRDGDFSPRVRRGEDGASLLECACCPMTDGVHTADCRLSGIFQQLGRLKDSHPVLFAQ
jgi:hypothetical protein